MYVVECPNCHYQENRKDIRIPVNLRDREKNQSSLKCPKCGTNLIVRPLS